MNIKTLLVRIPTIRFLYSAYKNAIDIRRLGGRSPLVTFLDEFYCNLFYGASPSDYKIFEFYRLKHHECNKFETIRYMKQNLSRKIGLPLQSLVALMYGSVLSVCY